MASRTSNAASDQPLLTSERLVIRRMDERDAPFIMSLVNDPDWLRFIGDRHVQTMDDARRYIVNGPMAMHAQHGFGFDVVALKATGVLMGICGLAQRDYLEDVDIGFAFLPPFRGKGYALEAASAVLRHAHTALGLKRIVATTRPDNANSIKLLERLGLRWERFIRHPNEDRDLSLFVIDFGAAP